MYTLSNQNALAFNPAGGAIPLVDPVDGQITVSLVPRACVGDCSGSGVVNISDLVTGVNIALGNLPVSACPAFQNTQGRVDIAQLIQGVNNALSGCPH